jgi:hypothetical protein
MDFVADLTAPSKDRRKQKRSLPLNWSCLFQKRIITKASRSGRTFCGSGECIVGFSITKD